MRLRFTIRDLLWLAPLFLIVSVVTVIMLGVICPESLEPMLYWSIPIFHSFLRPYTAGPHPAAVLCAILVDVFIVSGIILGTLMAISNRSNKTPPS